MQYSNALYAIIIVWARSVIHVQCINYKNMPRTVRNAITANTDTMRDLITISFVTCMRRLWGRFSKVPVDFVRTAP